MATRIYLVLLFLIGLFVSCQQEISDYVQYLKYLNEEDRGLSKSHEVLGMRIQLQYLPTDYLVYQELQHHSEKWAESRIDSLRNIYKTSLNFLMTLAPTEEEQFDVTKVGVSNYADYNQRIHQLSFQIQDQIYLQVGNQKIYPKIAHLERIYGLQKSRHLNIAFNRYDEQQIDYLKEDFHLVYRDQIFQTGINKFHFLKRDIEGIPPLDFSKLLQ